MNQRGFAWLPLLPYLIVGAAVVATLVGGYFYIDRNWATSAGVKKGQAEIQVKWDAAVAAQRAIEESKISEAAEKKEQGDAKAKVVYRDVIRQVDKLVIQWRDRACFDDAGVRVASDALRGTSPVTPKPNDPLPKLDGARGRPSSDGSAKGR